MDQDNSSDDSSEDEAIFNGAACVAVICIEMYYEKYVHKEPCMTSKHTGQKWVREVLNGHHKRCFNAFRMSKGTFFKLLSVLESKYMLQGSRRIGTIEILAMFLDTVARDNSNRDTQEKYQRSGETISRYFHYVLSKVLLLAHDIIAPIDPNFKETPVEIREDARYMPYFKDCIGAIDGVHISAVAPRDKQVQYIGRKHVVTQNVMDVCNFDMQFTFVIAGFPGICHDSSIFEKAVNDEVYNFLKPPPGKYYLVDSGYPLKRGYLTPYKGERYHLTQFEIREPTGYQEVFNHRHSSLRSVIERSFGVLKKKWKILKSMPSYNLETQKDIVIACMTIHNFIRRYNQSDKDFFDDEFGDDDDNDDVDGNDVDTDDDHDDGDTNTASNINNQVQEHREMEVLRNQIANSLII